MDALLHTSLPDRHWETEDPEHERAVPINSAFVGTLWIRTTCVNEQRYEIVLAHINDITLEDFKTTSGSIGANQSMQLYEDIDIGDLPWYERSSFTVTK